MRGHDGRDQGSEKEDPPATRRRPGFRQTIGFKDGLCRKECSEAQAKHVGAMDVCPWHHEWHEIPGRRATRAPSADMLRNPDRHKRQGDDVWSRHQMVDAEAPREQRGKQRGKGTELAGNAERYGCDGGRKRKGNRDEYTAPTEMVVKPGKADRC